MSARQYKLSSISIQCAVEVISLLMLKKFENEKILMKLLVHKQINIHELTYHQLVISQPRHRCTTNFLKISDAHNDGVQSVRGNVTSN